MRFLNKGTYRHLLGVDRNTGAMQQEDKQLAVSGLAPGAAIVNFPGHGVNQVVEQGGYVNLPDDLSVEVVQRACPALELVADVEVAPQPNPAPKSRAKDKE